MKEEKYKYQLAVVIVNYNVAYFLEQCLNSVVSASKNLEIEIFVVDNNSIDGSVAMVRNKFPNCKVIANKDNVGFSRANNQAIKEANSKYVLLLNPDTVVEEATFSKIISYMDLHDEVGGLGVRMVDGKGNYLPESKRGLPKPIVAFYKIFGLSALFPKSKRFGAYHLGYLDEHKISEIDVLSGAFMLMRTETLEKVGLLDEAFFMYGEDIDLSYRITQGGYTNVYYPETTIIHYKGESTKKSSVNYVFVFYRAMVIFAKKHFSSKNAKMFSLLINGAIYFRAFLAICARFLKKVILPIIDFLLILLGLLALANQWKMAGIIFPDLAFSTLLPGYALIWLFCIFVSGGYDKPIQLKSYLKGSFIGLAVILIIYALLPKTWQFSRLYILIGTVWTLLYYLISRIYLSIALKNKFRLAFRVKKRFAIVGSVEERHRVADILKQTQEKIDGIEYISTLEDDELNTAGSISQLDQIIYLHKIDEIIFCAKDITAKNIIKWMSKPTTRIVDYKIAQPDGYYLIGSNSIDSAADLYKMNINTITSNKNLRNKRLFDILAGIILLILSPFLIWFVNNKIKFVKNIFNVLFNRKTIVGYHIDNDDKSYGLPRIKPGVLKVTDSFPKDLDFDRDKINLIYARDYNVFKDFKILLDYWKKMGA